MIETTLNNLNKENCYEKSLQVIENICEDYHLDEYFGNISMFNQMICDYLIISDKTFDLDITFSFFDDDLIIKYNISTYDFSLLNNISEENTIYFVMERLSDEIIFSSDNNELISTFHVKTKTNINSSKRIKTLQGEVNKDIKISK